MCISSCMNGVCIVNRLIVNVSDVVCQIIYYYENKDGGTSGKRDGDGDGSVTANLFGRESFLAGHQFSRDTSEGEVRFLIVAF